MSSLPLVTLPDVTTGNAFNVAVQFTDATQNFASVVVTCYLAQATPPYTNPATQFTPVITFPLAGNTATFIVTLTLTGNQISGLGPGLYKGDIVLSMAGYGPYSAFSFSFNIVQGTTLSALYQGNLPVMYYTASATLTPNTIAVVQAATSGAVVFTLPTVTGSSQVIVVKNQSAQTVTINGALFTTAAVTTLNMSSTNLSLFNDGLASLGNGNWNTFPGPTGT
jgi:hypothetical protein